jgi:serine/threonine-protein kinase
LITAFQPGQVLGGKYRVEKVLGTGGMGFVVACQHIQLNQRVALKFLHPTMMENQEVVGRFLREAQAAVQIRSEHVVRVSDVATLDDGVPYMVMEYLEGTDLKETLERNGALPVATAVDYVLQACEALAEAHQLGIVHRDLKPNNLFLTKRPDGRPCVKVLDFGISKLSNTTPGVSNLTATSATLGTPYYMAPEQLTSTRSVDIRADIWALGIVLYELIAGATPFTGDTLAELFIRIVQVAPQPLPTVNPAVPTGLWEVISRCLQKNRDERYLNVAEVAFALAPYGSASAQQSLETISRIIPDARRASQMPKVARTTTSASTFVDEPGVARAHPMTTGQVAWGNTNVKPATNQQRALAWVGGGVAVVALGAVAWFVRAGMHDVANGSTMATASTTPELAQSSLPAPLELGSERTPTAAAPTLASAVAAATHDAVATAASASAAKVPASGLPAKEVSVKKRGRVAGPGHNATPNADSLIDDRR